jgi:CRP/FNR family cyclic AMP-dependent transcriptional regulator
MVLSSYRDTLSKRIAFVRELPLFAELSEADLAILISEFQLREYEKEEIIFHQGDDSRELYIVLQGKIRIYKTTLSGYETSIQIFFPGDVIGEFAVIDDQPRSATARTIENCQLLTIKGDQFSKYMQEMPSLALGMNRLLTSKVRWTAAYAETIAQYDAAGRLLHILLLYNDRIGQQIEPGKQYVIDLGLNQADLASLIGARREWVNRLLRNWHRRRLIKYEAGRIIILDLLKAQQERDSHIEATGPE